MSSPWQFYKLNQLQTFTPPKTSILEQIREYAQTSPEKDALVAMATAFKLSYQELVQALEQTIEYLTRECGLKPGDSIAMLMENEPELLVLNWACWSCGLKTVPLDIKRDTLERKIYKLQLTQAKVLVVRMDEADESEIEELRFKIKDLRVIELRSSHEYFDLTKPSGSYTPVSLKKGDKDTDCLVLFTSGTTGLPKGARLTPLSLWADATQIIEWLKITSEDRFHIVLPLHHINSTTFSLATILAGGTILLSPRYSKSGFWKMMAQSQATITSIVPTIAYDLLSEVPEFEKHKHQLTQITRIQVGSAPVQPTVVKAFYETYGIRLIQGYGSTETSLRCTGQPLELSETDYLAMIEENSIGTEMSLDNVAVLNNQMEEVAEGEEGEICIRGPIVTQGYLDNPKATEKAFQGGWFHSEDMGYWRNRFGHKFFYIKGRTKEIMIKGGVNISPLAIENAVLKHCPGITVCYAVGFDHPRLGEEIGLVVDGSAEGIDLLKKTIQHHAIPELKRYEQPVVVLSVEEARLPKTSTGKVQRVEIKRIYGPTLRLASQTVDQTEAYRFRLIWPDETDVLQQMVEIHNDRWPKPLQLTVELAQQQARNGIVVGVFQNEHLLGTIAGLQIPYQKLINQEPWTQTWDGISRNGTFQTHTKKGDCLVCVGITVKKQESGVRSQKPEESEKLKVKSESSRINANVKRVGANIDSQVKDSHSFAYDLLQFANPSLKSQVSTPNTNSPLENPILNTSRIQNVGATLEDESIEAYIHSGQDPVIGWHMKPKAGFTEGAKILQIIKDGRVADEEALGYSVLVEYPTLVTTPTINPSASVGTQLLEAALLCAYKLGIEKVVAYSRPAGLAQFLDNSSN